MPSKKKSRSKSVKVPVSRAGSMVPSLKSSLSKSSSSKVISHKVDFENLTSTEEVSVPKQLLEQVIGQDNCVEIVRKAAAQKRNVLLVGLPGTGKSLLAQAMSEVLPVGVLQDILICPNSEDPNNPKVRVLKSGEGKKVLNSAHLEAKQVEDSSRLVSFILPFGLMLIASVLWQLKWFSDVIFAALLLIGAVFLVAVTVSGQMRSRETVLSPKLLVNNAEKKIAPFFEATGARAGALLGDVRHDPLQCLVNVNKLIIIRGRFEKKISFEKLWNQTAKKYPDLVEKHEKGYEAIVLPKDDEVYTLGMKDGKVVRTRIYSLNRKPHDGEVIEISLQNEKVTTTPEHKVITKAGDKRADKISKKDSLFKLSSIKVTA
ncbi:MAG: ATP-binding protein [Candidatus Diapherotrites archaeon]|nr:ATP-binding protein [Candidatus Diapherotrites archaeon]